jgi:hypothetical protein
MSAAAALESPLLASVSKTLAAFTLLAGVITHLSMGLGPFLWGVLAAGGLQLANLYALTWLGGRLARAEPRGAAFCALLFMVKIGALVGLTIWALKTLPLDPFGFMVGVALLIPAALLASVLQPLAPSGEPVEVEA